MPVPTKPNASQPAMKEPTEPSTPSLAKNADGATTMIREIDIDRAIEADMDF